MILSFGRLQRSMRSLLPRYVERTVMCWGHTSSPLPRSWALSVHPDELIQQSFPVWSSKLVASMSSSSQAIYPAFFSSQLDALQCHFLCPVNCMDNQGERDQSINISLILMSSSFGEPGTCWGILVKVWTSPPSFSLGWWHSLQIYYLSN